MRVVAYYESGLGGVVKAMLGQEKGRDGSLGGTGQPGQERILVACDRLTDGWALPAASTPTNIFTWKLQKYLHSFHTHKVSALVTLSIFSWKGRGGFCVLVSQICTLGI